ncbi:hypothetical protein [Zavarzinia sp. CC-PAN008]|uniref:hypothetical protein n=1 Tax=Zavarzinia sp. CC-PAN008 TaxID=3243332 RepID=UPI003F74AB19
MSQTIKLGRAAAPAPRVVHEAETHRQHIRLRLPVDIYFDGEKHAAADWSVAGFSVDGVRKPRRLGDTFNVRLSFPLETYSFSLDTQAEVRFFDAATGRMGCRFPRLSHGDLSLLRFMVDAYISGEVVNAGDLLEVVQRDSFVAPRKPPPVPVPATLGGRVARTARRVTAGVALGLVGLGLAGYVGYAVYQRTFVVTYAGTVSSPDVQLVRAPKAGVFHSANLRVQQDVTPQTVIATIEGADGIDTSVASTCDCFVGAAPIPEGSVVSRGEVVAMLVPRGGEAVASVRLPIESARNVEAGDRASIETFDGTPIRWGSVRRVERHAPIESSSLTPLSASFAVVTIVPDAPLPIANVGEPVDVRIHTARLTAFGLGVAPREAVAAPVHSASLQTSAR